MSHREPDATEIVKGLGAVFSPDLDAYTSGRIPIQQVRCVLCGHAPCTCIYCPEIHQNIYLHRITTNHPEFEPCGMRVDPATGECPRGHRYAGTGA